MTLAELENAHTAAVKDAQREYDWYARHRWSYVILSWLTRGLGAVALVFGVLLPLCSSTGPTYFLRFTFASPAQAALACLAFAGLMVGADKLFMISATWIRYVSAMMKIKTFIKATDLDWVALKEGFTDPISPPDVQKALALFKALVVGARQIVEAETSSWSAELVKAIEDLRTLVSAQKTTIEALAKEQQQTREAAQKLASASTQGTVRVKIEGAVERLVGSINVTVAGRSEDRNSPVTTVVLPEVFGGIHKVTLAGRDVAGKPVLVEDVVQVVPSSIADIALAIPKV